MRCKFRKRPALQPDISNSTPESLAVEPYINHSTTHEVSSPLQASVAEASNHTPDMLSRTEPQTSNTYADNMAVNAPLELQYSSTAHERAPNKLTQGTEPQTRNTYADNVAINAPLEGHYQPSFIPTGQSHRAFATDNTWFPPEYHAAMSGPNHS